MGQWGNGAVHVLDDLEVKVAGGASLTRDEAARVGSCTDLVSVGTLGELARKAMHGNRVTFGRVCEVRPGAFPGDPGSAGEVRLAAAGTSFDAFRQSIVAARTLAGHVPLTGGSLADLMDVVRGDPSALTDLAGALSRDGLEAVAEAPVDRLGELAQAVEAIRALRDGGLGVWRLTVDRAAAAERLDLIDRAAALAAAVGGILALAPLPRVDPPDLPSTGYDDVRTIAVARLRCRQVASIQVDWPLYGPKLAQVAIAFGADDLDGVTASDEVGLGRRRSPREEIERHIRAAFAEPVERNARYELRS
jgi:CofH/MqnC C-terminal region